MSHKRLELFSLIFSHSGAGAPGLDALQRLFAPVELLDNGVHGCRPHERLRVAVPGSEEFLNGLP